MNSAASAVPVTRRFVLGSVSRAAIVRSLARLLALRRGSALGARWRRD